MPRATVTSRPRSVRRPRAPTTGKKFLADYKAADYAEPSAAYGGYSYDAANAIIAGLKASLAERDATPSRLA